MKILKQEMLDSVIRRLVKALAPDSVYLYGSHAYGKPQVDSDIDLLVVVPDQRGTPYSCSVEACKALRGVGLPVEVKVVTRSKFMERGGWLSSVEHVVRERGRLLYGAAT
jgi:predicted nucleotidyltransferase